METISKYSKFIPYLYFLTIIAYWFTQVNRDFGINAFPILLFGIPFIWQLFKPNRKLNFTLGITFVCLSSYLILVYISDAFNIVHISEHVKQMMWFSGLLVMSNFIMALWMIKNSLHRSF